MAAKCWLGVGLGETDAVMNRYHDQHPAANRRHAPRPTRRTSQVTDDRVQEPGDAQATRPPPGRQLLG
jgi:hypothetical protein